MHRSFGLFNLTRYTDINLHPISNQDFTPKFRKLLQGLRIRKESPERFVPSKPDLNMPKIAYYAVNTGRKPGIYLTWDEAKKQVEGFPGAKFKKFNDELSAQQFLLPSPISQYTTKSLGSSNPANQIREPSPPTFANFDDLPNELVTLAKEGYKFSQSKPHHLVVYTDGSSLGNGQNGAKAGLGVWWGSYGSAERLNLSQRVPGDLQTNNRGELLAVIRALELCPFPDLPLEIRTDSKYSIQCITEYLPKWLNNNFKSRTGPVKNLDMIKHLLVLLRRRGRTSVKFKHVPAHVGLEGNEGADRLAKRGAVMPLLPETNDWLDPDDEDQRVLSQEPTSIDVEIDPSFFATEEELAEELA